MLECSSQTTPFIHFLKKFNEKQVSFFASKYIYLVQIYLLTTKQDDYWNKKVTNTNVSLWQSLRILFISMACIRTHQ